MNYTKIYNDLIVKGKTRVLTEDIHTETHHIIPRCMNGNDSKENLVDLTPEEHYTAHLLLVKIYLGNRKLIHAAGMMAVSGKNLHRSRNKQYGWIKRKLVEVRREMMSGENSPNYGKPGHFTGGKHTIEAKAKISKAATGRILGPLSEETKNKISVSNIGKHSQNKSIETKKKISDTQKDVPWSQKRRNTQNKKDAESNSLFKKISLSLLSKTENVS
jgi:hypothetical protein